MDCGDGSADPRIGKRPDPALTGSKRLRPGPDAADNQNIDQAGDHQRRPWLPGRVLNEQELGDITDKECGLIVIPGDVNNMWQEL
jgi:hypothetical protein